MTELGQKGSPSVRCLRGHLLDPHSYLATILFPIGSAVLFLLFYSVPDGWWQPLLAAVGLALLLFFGWYLYAIKRNDRASLGSALPAVLGPVLALLYVQRQAPHLLDVWHSGGGLLVQIAFLFASWIGLVVYQFTKLGEDGQSKRVVRLGYLVTLVIILVVAFAPLEPNSSELGPYLFGDYRAPAPSGLTFCRALVVLWGIAMATLPEK